MVVDVHDRFEVAFEGLPLLIVGTGKEAFFLGVPPPQREPVHERDVVFDSPVGWIRFMSASVATCQRQSDLRRRRVDIRRPAASSASQVAIQLLISLSGSFASSRCSHERRSPGNKYGTLRLT